jgi:hypothetical protein
VSKRPLKKNNKFLQLFRGQSLRKLIFDLAKVNRMAAESAFLHVMISLGILLFAAKLMAELFHRIKLP